MRIQFLAPWGDYGVGDIINAEYSQGANLCFAGFAKEVLEDVPVKVAAVEAPPRDKMLKRNQPHMKQETSTRKRGRPKGSKNKSKARPSKPPIEVMTINENQNV